MPLAEHDLQIPHVHTHHAVSIHVPLAEHDSSNVPTSVIFLLFQFTCPSRSTTSADHDGVGLREFQFTCPSRSTTGDIALNLLNLEFQFTCPSRSTTSVIHDRQVIAGVSIHVPLAEHDYEPVPGDVIFYVSIHVPLAEHDPRATLDSGHGSVSIHVPLAEHDIYHWRYGKYITGFNSRAPRGARPLGRVPFPLQIGFQFTCPSRSTTPKSDAK